MPSLSLIRTLCYVCSASRIMTAFATASSIPTFDYVIVGGGTAGALVANRLSQQSDLTVALIEAGTWPTDVVGNITQVPAYAYNFGGFVPQIEWNFTTTPQAGLNGSTRPYYRIRALGGCSDGNYMAYAQTSIGALDLWAKLVDDQSYTYNNIVQYYDKSMNFTPPDSLTRYANATPVYNPHNVAHGGLLQYSYPAFAQSWSTWVAKGFQAIGMYKTAAFINGRLNGSSWAMLTIDHKTGFRSSAVSAFLSPITSRSNLHIFNGTFAEKIVFDNGSVATGVIVSRGNDTWTIRAKKEVILSAGVFQSPHLLQVSGIGPARLLGQFDIPVIKDLPGVGQNMDDHIVAPVSYRVNVQTDSTLTGAKAAAAVAQFNANGTGPLSNSGGDFVGLEKIPKSYQTNFTDETLAYLASLPSDWPQLEYLVLPQAVEGDTVTGGQAVTAPGDNYGSILFALVAAQSRGNVTIQSAEMQVPPLINPNWFTAQADRDLMVAGFKRARAAFQSSAMAPVIIGDEFFPGPSTQTDEQIIQYLEQQINPVSHAFGTCKMGNASDPAAVVDSKGRVFGITNLRVIDASAFPFVPPGPSPQAQVYMLAEKLAAEIIASAQTKYA